MIAGAVDASIAALPDLDIRHPLHASPPWPEAHLRAIRTARQAELAAGYGRKA